MKTFTVLSCVLSLATLVGAQGVTCSGDATPTGSLLYPLDVNDGLVDFFGDGATGSGPATGVDQNNNDDSATITLPFPFDFFGTAFTGPTVFVNNNGNISFGSLFSTATPSSFPVLGTSMIAPFWTDVDTGNTANDVGDVWMKFLDSAPPMGVDTLVVTWDNVGHFDEQGTLRNTFQVAISDGTNPIMGIGNNVCLSYDNMCWTTGQASGGVDGFGGTPAAVGINSGNRADFFVVGLFDHEGSDYGGPAGGNDGVSSLDGQTFCFDVSGMGNTPPVVVDSAGGSITVVPESGTPLSHTVYFLSPESAQTTTIAVDDTDDAQGAGLTITTIPGAVASVKLEWAPECADFGTYALTLQATDDASAPASTAHTVTIKVPFCLRPYEPRHVCAKHGPKGAPTDVCAGPCPQGPDSFGDPVYLFSGEFHESQVDLQIKGRGLDFIWARKYRSSVGPNTATGNGWDSSYNIELLPGNFEFVRGDCNGDGIIDVSDPIFTLDFLFLGGVVPSCEDACDTNDDGAIQLADAIASLAYIFGIAGALPAPNACGPDPTADSLSCGAYTGCAPSELILCDGDSRQDVFERQAGGIWARDEYFQTIEEAPGGGYQMAFPDTSSWTFGSTGSAEGKLVVSTDRNGNSLTFEYDGIGQLATIRDTLDTPGNPRAIAITYNPDGFIESVTDFLGRSVTYDYYQDGDAGGSFGDLKSVTTPTVTGTPTGNDFPTGKTTTYTYSKGFADENLNHNLLTITDPKGQTYLTNVYATTADPADVDYDRVVRQVWGDPTDVIDFVYRRLIPDPSNQNAVLTTVVNDRVGNVRQSFFDALNRNVMLREHTGRAIPNQPTDIVGGINLPVAPLRVGDPPFFETRWEYNDDSRVTARVFPNGNREESVYDTANLDRRAHGNRLLRRLLPGPLGGDQPQIEETFEYDDGFGGCCGTNFVTRHVDGRGNETIHTYDPAGNRTHTQHRIPTIVEDWEYNAFGQVTAHILPDNGSGSRRRDEFSYYAAGAQTGYLQQQTIDATGFILTTTYTYDGVGNLVTVTDPGGHEMEHTYNALDQIVRQRAPAVSLPAGNVRYERDVFYDANDNVVRVDIQNVDDQGNLQPNTHFTTIYEYDILNYVTRNCAEVGDYNGAIPGSPGLPTCAGLPPADFITTEHQYDGNRNRILIRKGEATNGNQPLNVVSGQYDERDLLFREVRSPGGPNQSTTQYDYDGNGNLATRTQGLEGAPRVSSNHYDGYDRIWAPSGPATIDPMGNESEHHYDANGNLVSIRVDGELFDALGSVNNTRLFETAHAYDAMDRRTTESVQFFDANTQAPLLAGATPDGVCVTTTEWTDNSQVALVRNDNLHETVTTYDSANRVATVVDAKSNSTTYTYDADSLLTAVTEDHLSDLGSPPQGFTTTHGYDSLHRRTTTTDNVGNTHSWGYDSRDNRTVTTDPLNETTRRTYDGLSRLTSTIHDLDGDGADGDGTDVVTTQEWDDSSRLVGQGDSNGNVTSYGYDPLDRRIVTTFADQTTATTVYDAHDNPVARLDANGSSAIVSYDLLNRVVNKNVMPGPGVSIQTTFESYSYDGLSRVRVAADDDSSVSRDYDSLSHVTAETLDGQVTSHVFDCLGNELLCVYPGGRSITGTYDELERKKTISDAVGLIASYDYVGRSRVERRDYGNGTRCEYTYDGITGVPNPPSDFGVKRIIGTQHTQIGTGTILDDRSYAWDPLFSKKQRRDVRAAGQGLTHDHQYDAIDRLVHSTVTAPGPVVLRDTDYALDGVGNRSVVVGAPDPGAYVGPYLLDGTQPIPADAPMNQYTMTPADARLYDPNSNLTRRNNGQPTQRIFTYDYRDQLVEVIDAATGLRHTYAYDPLGRRVGRTFDTDGVLLGSPVATRYFYDDWQVVEEQDALGALQGTFVYGLYVDEVLNMQRGAANYYYHGDDLHNVMAITDATGGVVERYEYGDYGQPVDPITVVAISGNVSSVENPYLFNGRRYDAETGWYYYRTRYLDPVAGRFTTRDTIGIWGDAMNVGNGFSYVGGNPVSRVDPFGETIGRAVEFPGVWWFVRQPHGDRDFPRWSSKAKFNWKSAQMNVPNLGLGTMDDAALSESGNIPPGDSSPPECSLWTHALLTCSAVHHREAGPNPHACGDCLPFYVEVDGVCVPIPPSGELLEARMGH